jgi:hypothetical protein
MVKPLHSGFQLIGLFIVRQKLNLQSQFHEGAAYRQIGSRAKKLSSRRLDDAKFLSTHSESSSLGGESFGGNVEACARGNDHTWSVPSVPAIRSDVYCVCGINHGGRGDHGDEEGEQ